MIAVNLHRCVIYASKPMWCARLRVRLDTCGSVFAEALKSPQRGACSSRGRPTCRYNVVGMLGKRCWEIARVALVGDLRSDANGLKQRFAQRLPDDAARSSRSINASAAARASAAPCRSARSPSTTIKCRAVMFLSCVCLCRGVTPRRCRHSPPAFRGAMPRRGGCARRLHGAGAW